MSTPTDIQDIERNVGSHAGSFELSADARLVNEVHAARLAVAITAAARIDTAVVNLNAPVSSMGQAGLQGALYPTSPHLHGNNVPAAASQPNRPDYASIATGNAPVLNDAAYSGVGVGGYNGRPTIEQAFETQLQDQLNGNGLKVPTPTTPELDLGAIEEMVSNLAVHGPDMMALGYEPLESEPYLRSDTYGVQS